MNDLFTVLNSDPDTVSYEDLIGIYLDESPHIARRTRIGYRLLIEAFVKWLGDRPINVDVMERYVDWQKNSGMEPSFVEKRVMLAFKFGRWLWKRKYIDADPTEDIKKPRVPSKKPKQGYTPEEYRQMVDFFQAEERYHHFMSFCIIAYHTGFSCIDVCLLTWREVDLEKGFITRVRSKMAHRTGSESVVPILEGSDLKGELIRLALQYGKKADGYVNPMLALLYKREPNDYEQPGRLFINELGKVTKLAGVMLRGTHGFRRQMLTKLANEPTMNLLHATAISGHRDVNMLKRYVTVNPEAIRDSVTPTLRALFDATKPKASAEAEAVRNALHSNADKRPVILATVTEKKGNQ